MPILSSLLSRIFASSSDTPIPRAPPAPNHTQLYKEIISLTLLCLALLSYTSLFTLLTTRRLIQPLKIRLYPLLMYHYVCEMILLSVSLSRIILNENDFPCLIHRLSMYLCVPGVILPWVLNGARVLFVFQMGRVKERYRFENGMVRSQHRRGGNMEVSSEERLDEMVNAATEERESTNMFDAPRGGTVFGGNDAYISPFGAEDPMDKPLEKSPKSEFLRQKHILLKIGNIIFNKWVIILYILVHSILGGLVFLGEIFLYKESSSVTTGCINRTLYGSIWFSVYAVLHFLLMVVILVAQHNMKERFMLKWESRLIALGVTIFGVLSMIWTFLPATVSFHLPIAWFTFVFFMFDSILTGWIPTMLTLKSTYGFQWVEDVSTYDPTKIKSLMTNHIMRNYFMDFCQKEFSLENPNFWLDVHYFRTVAAHQRTYIAYQIIETYFRSSSPMEINIPSTLKRDYLTRISTLLAAVAKQVKENQQRRTPKRRSKRAESTFGMDSGMENEPESEIFPDFFDDALLAVENNMLDTFSRFIHNEKYSEMIKTLESQNQHLKTFSAL